MTGMQLVWLIAGVILVVALFAGTAYAVRRRNVSDPGIISPHEDLSADHEPGADSEPGYHEGESHAETTTEDYQNEARSMGHM